MATRIGQLLAGRSGVDFTVQLDMPWNAPEVFVNMDSLGLHELDTESMPDAFGLRARQPGAAIIRVMTVRDSRSVRALVPDRKVLDRGFHDVRYKSRRYESCRWTRGPGGRIGYATINAFVGLSRIRARTVGS